MGFSRQEYWSRLPVPSLGDLPDAGIESVCLVSRALQEDSLPAEPEMGCLLSTFYCSVAQPCLTLCDSMDCSTPGFPVLHRLLEFAQIHVHWVNNAIQTFDPLSSPLPPALHLSQHQVLSQSVSSLHLVAIVLELQLQHQSFQWIFRVDFL